MPEYSDREEFKDDDGQLVFRQERWDEKDREQDRKDREEQEKKDRQAEQKD
jgi:hypothetical protein